MRIRETGRTYLKVRAHTQSRSSCPSIRRSNGDKFCIYECFVKRFWNKLWYIVLYCDYTYYGCAMATMAMALIGADRTPDI